MDVGYGGVWVSIYIGASVAAVWIISVDMGGRGGCDSRYRC